MVLLQLKSGSAFMEMRCKYAAADAFKRQQARVALVVEPSPRKLEDGRQVAALEIEHPEGPLKHWVAHTLQSGPPLKVGDLVFWLPVSWSFKLAWMFKSIRRGWVGFIIASVDPQLNLDTSNVKDGFSVRHWYMNRQ